MANAAKFKNLGRTQGVKALGVGFLVLIMFLPMGYVRDLVWERQLRAEDARDDVGNSWGGLSQTIAGPFLVVPFDNHYSSWSQGQLQERVERHYAVFLPGRFTVTGDLKNEVRYRGIYDITVYRGDLVLQGAFEKPDMAPFVEADDEVHWEEAFVSLHVTDVRGVKNALQLAWGEGKTLDFLPGPAPKILAGSGVHTPLGAGGPLEAAEFRIDLALNGSRSIRFLPAGRETEVSLASDWPHPSFQGGFLPSTRVINEEGFEASWQIPFLARGFPQAWTVSRAMLVSSDEEIPFAEGMDIRRTVFGVNFPLAIDFYLKVERSTKYAVLFFGFTFLTFFLYETLLPLRIHVVQYLMVGLSQCIFYLLLLSLSEHIGFVAAYALAAAANIGLITLYAGYVLRSRRFALAMLVVLLTIYALLFSLLQVRDYALLLGSIAAFLGLAATMYFTRNVNWYGDEASDESAAPDARLTGDPK